MICGSMGRSLLPHPKPVRRKTSDLDGYYKNGIPTTTASVGDSVGWDVPGHSPGTVYLVQTVNGQPGYNGPIAVPMSPFALTAAQVGQWQNTVYDKQGGSVIETDGLTVAAAQAATPATPIQCPDGYTYYAPYTDPAGNPQPGGCQVSTKPTGTTTTPTATGAGSGAGGSGGGSTTTSTTSTTSSTTSTSTPAAAAPPNDTLLLVAVAALAFVLLK